ncbi:MAG: hypothetical protein OER95_15380, partial [Acidimicrobiia bacterium]|nr:hypothetical protein [Acidimicrobiia bacterium]
MTAAVETPRFHRGGAEARRRAVLLAWLTVGWNLVEAAVALGAGAAADSSALIGFGLDSTIEVSSALVVLWQFRASVPEARERLALRLIALSFLALAAWVVFAAVTDLVQRSKPD